MCVRTIISRLLPGDESLKSSKYFLHNERANYGRFIPVNRLFTRGGHDDSVTPTETRFLLIDYKDSTEILSR